MRVLTQTKQNFQMIKTGILNPKSKQSNPPQQTSTIVSFKSRKYSHLTANPQFLRATSGMSKRKWQQDKEKRYLTIIESKKQEFLLPHDHQNRSQVLKTFILKTEVKLIKLKKKSVS